MMLDGEWRVAFIAADHAKIRYATAPFPVADNMAADYGEGLIGGDIIGIPRGAPNSEAAWQVVKYLALATQPEERLGELLKNVPTTLDALKDPALSADPHFAPFLRIFGDPRSGSKQITPLGGADSELLFTFIDRYEAGGVANLQAGLQSVASRIDQAAGS